MAHFPNKRLAAVAAPAFSRFMVDINLLRELTGASEAGFGIFESKRPDIPSGPVYVVKKDDAAEIAAILNEHIPDGAQPFFGHAGRVQVGMESLFRYRYDLQQNKGAIRADIKAFEAQTAAPSRTKQVLRPVR